MVSFQDVYDEYNKINNICAKKINFQKEKKYCFHDPSLYIPEVKKLYSHYWSTITESMRGYADILDIKLYKYMNFIVIFHFKKTYESEFKDELYCKMNDCINVYKIDNNSSEIFKNVASKNYGYRYVYLCAISCYSNKQDAKKELLKYLLNNNEECNKDGLFISHYHDSKIVCDLRNIVFLNGKNDNFSSDDSDDENNSTDSDEDQSEIDTDNELEYEELYNKSNNTYLGYVYQYIRSIHGTNTNLVMTKYKKFLESSFSNRKRSMKCVKIWNSLLSDMIYFGCIYDECNPEHSSRASMNITALFSHKYGNERVYILYHYEDEYNGKSAEYHFYKYKNKGYTMKDFFEKSFRIIREEDFDLFGDIYKVVKDIKTNSVINYMYLLNKKICELNGSSVNDEYYKLCDKIIDYECFQ